MSLFIDYRKLNAVTKTNAHFYFFITNIFDTLTAFKYFCTLILVMGTIK